MPNFRLSNIAVALVAAMFFWQLNYAPLWNPDEGRYAAASLEMAQGFEGARADWTIPHLNTVPRLNKPPLVYWTGAAALGIFGDNEFAARVVSALAALGVLALVWLMGRSMFSARAGILGALVWGTATLPFGLARVLNTDMLLCFAITLAFYGIWRFAGVSASASGDEPKVLASTLKAYLIAGVLAGSGMGLALLAKGPVGVALPLLIGAVFLLATKQLWPPRWVAPLAVALVITLVIGAPWYLAMEARVPGFVRDFVFAENLGRFSGKEDFHDPKPIYFYLPIIVLGLLPWSGFLIPAAAKMLVERQAALFLWLWGGLLAGFFSLSSTKLITYVLPAFPAFCLLIGATFAPLWQDKDNAGPLRIKLAATWQSGVVISLLFNLVLIIAGCLYLLDEKTLPRSVAMPFVVALFVLMLPLSGWIFWASRRGEVRGVFGAQLATAVGLHFLLLPLAGRISVYEDASPIVKAMRGHLQPQDDFILYRTFQPTTIFYLERPVTIVDFYNNSGLEEKALERSRFFQKSRDGEFLRERWRQSAASNNDHRIWVLTRWNQLEAEDLPAPHFLLARNNDYRLYSNRPAPPDFQYDFVAPRKLDR